MLYQMSRLFLVTPTKRERNRNPSPVAGVNLLDYRLKRTLLIYRGFHDFVR